MGCMRRRSARYLGAHFAILAMLFSQLALATYACASSRPVGPVPTAHSSAAGDAGQVPCAAMLSPAESPQGNACEVHCNDGLTSAGQPDLPLVTLAVLPAPPLAPEAFADAREVVCASWVPLPGAPPPIVRFCRLLI